MPLRVFVILPFEGQVPAEIFNGGRWVSHGFLPRIERFLQDRKSTRLNSSHTVISYAVFCLKKKKTRICSPAMATLAFKFEEITPRKLKPELYQLDGISRATIEAHYKLYEGYVNKRNEILQKLDGVDTSSANQVYSDIRALKVDLTF